MKEHGLNISLNSEQDLFVYYLPLTYLDWIKCTDSSGILDPDPATVRYLFQTYITRTFVREKGTDDPVDRIIQPYEVAELSPPVIANIIAMMREKSGFTDKDKYAALVESITNKSMDLIGSYDYFIFIHLGIDAYLKALSLDAFSRANIISIIERNTGISVQKRFDDCIKYELPLDLLSDPNKYENDMRQKMKTGKIRMETNRPKTTPTGAYPTPEKPPVNSNDLVEASRQALQQELVTRQQNKQAKQKFFSWQDDQAAIEQFERKSDKSILDKKIGPADDSTPHVFGVK